jgi:hypothetical protein
MTVDYLGFHINAFTYISLILFALIVFVIIMIATEKERQRRHHTERLRIMKKHAELKMMNDKKASETVEKVDEAKVIEKKGKKK